MKTAANIDIAKIYRQPRYKTENFTKKLEYNAGIEVLQVDTQ